MFRLFTDQVPNPNRNIVFPAWRYINEKIQQNLAVLIRYYRSVEEPIPNQNIIARILNDTFIDPTLDTLTYVEEVEKSKDRLNQYGIVSNRNLGHVFNKGYTGSNEMFYSVQNQLFLYNISSTWRKLVPLRMVYTNNSNLDYEIRYGKMVSKDYTIFEIDYVKLMVMYKEWCLNRMQSRFEINPNTFISQYVFPNMLTESINIILFSRLIDRFYNVDIPKTKITYPFYLIDVTADIDKVINLFIKENKNRRLDVEKIINTFPNTTEDKSTLDIVRLSEYRFLQQSNWILWLSRLPWIKFLIDFLGDIGKKYNIDLINNLQKYFLSFQSNNVPIPKSLSPENLKKFQDTRIELQDKVFPHIRWLKG